MPPRRKFYDIRVYKLLYNASMKTQKLRLGPREIELLFTLEKKNRRVFEFPEVLQILASGRASAWNVLYRLKKKGRIEELEKGKYLLIPARAGVEGSWSEVPYLFVPALVDTYYVGFSTALNYWGLTEQTPRTVFVVSPKRKLTVAYGPTVFQFVTLSKKKFFGWTETEMGGGAFLISDREKTIIDCLGLPDYAGGLGEVVKAIRVGFEELDSDKLLKYAKRYGVNALLCRLGYILQVLDLASDVRERIASMTFPGYLWLDPNGPKKRLGYSAEYGLILNRTEEELLAWRGT